MKNHPSKTFSVPKEQYVVLSENEVVSGTILSALREKTCRNGNHLAYFSVSVFERTIDEKTGVYTMAERLKNILFFDEQLIKQARKFAKDDYISVRGQLRQKQVQDESDKKYDAFLKVRSFEHRAA